MLMIYLSLQECELHESGDIVRLLHICIPSARGSSVFVESMKQG